MTNAKLRDDQWEKIYSFLQHHPRAYAGKEDECRLFVEAVFWVLRSGAQWRLLPEKFGHWNSVYKRFARWCDHQVWEERCINILPMTRIWRIFCWIAPSYEHIPVPLELQKKWRAGKPGARTQPGRVQHQDPRQRRCPGQSAAVSSDWRAAT